MTNRQLHGRFTLVANLEDPKQISNTKPRSEEEAVHIAERHDSVLSSWGALAMFEWRHGLGDFRKRLKTAVESGVKAAQALLPYRTPRDYLAPIHLAPAMYLSRLTHRRFLPDLVAILPDF